MSTHVALQQDLRELNVEMGTAEKDHNVEFLREVLHDDLLFRSADGSFVGKDEYLNDLQNRIYEVLEVDVAELDASADSAVVTVIATATGTSHAQPFAGTFRHVRTFVKDGERWRCRLWIITRIGMETRTIHHVSLPVTDLERSKRFYREILGLREIERPAFDFPGAWFGLGDDHLHLIVNEEATFRGEKGVESRDIHFAVRVRCYREALQFLESKGYRIDADERDPFKLKASPHATAGFPQIYILDPDRNVIEINAEKLDLDSP